MVLEVIFETKHKVIPQGVVTYAVTCMDVCGSIIEEEKQFRVKLTGEEQKVFEVLRAIWEISFLYEGYFYNEAIDETAQDGDAPLSDLGY